MTDRDIMSLEVLDGEIMEAIEYVELYNGGERAMDAKEKVRKALAVLGLQDTSAQDVDVVAKAIYDAPCLHHGWKWDEPGMYADAKRLKYRRLAEDFLAKFVVIPKQ